MCGLIKSIRERDPANPTFAEVLFAYNGFHAVVLHRMNNFIWHLGLRGLARFFANLTRFLTGIEIHPEATIGQNLFIDHGTGVVIGQTAIIGDNVTIYHGVTLGGVGKAGNVEGKRHPTIESGAIIGAGAQLLGDITIGEGAKIGANSVVTTDIPAHATAIGIPARVVGGDDKARAYGMPSREEMADLISTMDCLIREMGHIKKELNLNTGKEECAPESLRDEKKSAAE
ncbi:MAG: serine O-acetyltransferase [Rhodospirillales bacterium]|nr:serine O-acetyltransferase [Alphaproteobacteria bacterium]MCB1839193.1 serine O-acetyltransferase [Alphaproteobacteria bacterium]MCB9976118.1 serine O-acetyltransferase [Rhodospirillales bacterium]